MISVFLHGFGSTGQLFHEAWTRGGHEVPADAVFLDGAEHEPLTRLRRWFALSGSDARLAASLADSAEGLEETIASILRRRGAGPQERISLTGHSQGGMLALDLACRARLPIAEVRCFASFLPSDRPSRPVPGAADARITLHSSLADKYVSHDRVERTVRRLRAFGLRRVSHKVAQSLPHQFSHHWLEPATFSECPT